ncbi:PLP-dependent transferase [Mesorhizobium huakuii]|uniref:Uncharacterized protein n=1 Tax=Mesorhizobium huakuii TaxID=28104 RepID=A0A7G6T1E4_9HYPH|nr:hypothetical protein HB778_31655 [Mesorhizobium huakuii]
MHSATKYIGGHSRSTLRLLVGTPRAADTLPLCFWTSGGRPSGDEYGTLPIRMPAHWEGAQKVAQALASHPRVEKVLFPGLQDDPGHESGYAANERLGSDAFLHRRRWNRCRDGRGQPPRACRPGDKPGPNAFPDRASPVRRGSQV